MKNSIDEVQGYFKNKIITGQYDVIEIDTYTIKILIDEEYIFNLWIANDGFNFGTYECIESFMSIKFEAEDIFAARTEATINPVKPAL